MVVVIYIVVVFFTLTDRASTIVVVVVFTLKKAVSISAHCSVLSNIPTGPTDANVFRGHRLTTQKGYTYQKEIKGPRKVNTHAIIGK